MPEDGNAEFDDKKEAAFREVETHHRDRSIVGEVVDHQGGNPFHCVHIREEALAAEVGVETWPLLEQETVHVLNHELDQVVFRVVNAP